MSHMPLPPLLLRDLHLLRRRLPHTAPPRPPTCAARIQLLQCRRDQLRAPAALAPVDKSQAASVRYVAHNTHAQVGGMQPRIGVVAVKMHQHGTWARV
eukprot:332172-Chlamydomonas_euryale.AAC.1